MLTPQWALRVAPGCSAPLLPCVALRGLDTIGPGQGSRSASRTGKLGFGQCRLDHGVPLWVEGDGADGCPIAAPAPWVVLPCLSIACLSRIEPLAVFVGMALCRRAVTDATVPMVMVVPPSLVSCRTSQPRGLARLHQERTRRKPCARSVFWMCSCHGSHRRAFAQPVLRAAPGIRAPFGGHRQTRRKEPGAKHCPADWSGIVNADTVRTHLFFADAKSPVSY